MRVMELILLFALAFGSSAVADDNVAQETVLIYEAVVGSKNEAVDMPKLVRAVERRINGFDDKKVATVKALEGNRLEVRVSAEHKAKAKHIEELLANQARLEMRILASRDKDKELVAAAEKNKDETVFDPKDSEKELKDREPIGRWVRVRPDMNLNKEEVVRTNDQKEKLVLVVMDPHNVTNDYLKSVAPGIDDRGQSVLFFTLNDEGARRMGMLTGENLPDPVQGRVRRLGIVLDGVTITAPGIQSKIGDQGQISGSFTEDEIRKLANALKLKPLPCPIRLVEKLPKE